MRDTGCRIRKILRAGYEMKIVDGIGMLSQFQLVGCN